MSHAERLRQLRARFLADVPARLARIEALVQTDRDAARRAAHNLRGTAASLELPLHGHAEALERALASRADSDEIARLIGLIRESAARSPRARHD